MNAGSDITHSEFSTKDTTVLHGLQLWYALPNHSRFSAPALTSYQPRNVVGDGFTAKVFLGELLGEKSPVPTYIPLTGVELRLDPSVALDIDVPANHGHGLVQVTGQVSIDGVEVPQDAIGFTPQEDQLCTLRLLIGLLLLF